MPYGHRAEIEQLARLLDGDARTEGASPAARELATLATAVRQEIRLPEPDPAFEAALRRRLLEQPAVTPVPDARTRPGVLVRVFETVAAHAVRLRDSARVAVASGLVSMMIGTTGVAVASQQALPGEFLYPVKQVTETVRLTLASDGEARGRLHLLFARERLEEVLAGSGELPASVLIATLDAMDRATLTGTNELLMVLDRTGGTRLLDYLREFARHQRTGLDEVRGAAPVVLAPFIERSMEVLRRIEVRVSSAGGPCAVCPAGEGARAASTPQRPATVAAPGEGPAVAPGDDACGCAAPSRPVPGRPDPGVAEQPDGPTGPTEPPVVVSPDLSGEPDLPGNDGSTRVLIPELPDPLDPIGRELDRLIGGVLDQDVSDPETTDVPEAEVTDDPDADLGGLIDPLG